MLSEHDNTLLTRVGPDTPMGSLLRRYWHPIAAVRELAERPTCPIKILGEDLVLYRDRRGGYGLIERRCPHRGADLAYGIVDERGLRCSYHGWCFDARGHCVDQPFEQVARPDSTFRDKIRLASYQTAVKAGLIWAYLGPAPAPCLTDWARFYEAGQPSVTFTHIPCNWLQCQENSIDPVHFEWLHQNLEHARAGRAERAPGHREIDFEETDYGYVYRRVLEGKDKSDPLWVAGRSTLWPNGLFAGGFVWHVPMDDTHTTFVTWDLIPTRRPIEEAHYRRGELQREANGLYKMHDFVHQDSVGMVGQGRIADRTREALGESDRGIILLRRRLLADLAALEHAEPGWDPKAIVRDEARNHRVPLPFSALAMPGFQGYGMRARLRARASALLDRAARLGQVVRLPPAASGQRPLAIARGALETLRGKAPIKDTLARVRRVADKARRPRPPELTDLIHGYQTSALLYVVARLGVADAIGDTPKAAAEIARLTEAHPPTLERILRALVERDLLAFDGARFALTPLISRLRRDAPDSARGLALLAGEEFMPAFGALLHAARTGDTPFRHVFGMSNWEHRREHPELSEAYHAMSLRASPWAAERVLAGCDLSRAEEIVDVGGGRGAFLAHLLTHLPKARGTLFDEAHVLADAPPLLTRLGVADRCRTVAGDFRDEVPAGADTYLLKNVLHNWSDADARTILATCRRAMTHPGARLLVLEAVLPEAAIAQGVKTSDLHRLVIDGGRERTETEYRALSSASGLRCARALPLAGTFTALELVVG